MKPTWKLPESITLEKMEASRATLSLILTGALAAAQVSGAFAAESQAQNKDNNDHGASVRVHSSRAREGHKAEDLDSTINKLRQSPSKNSLPSSMFEPWWRTMLHDPDGQWIMRNFDIMSSDPGRMWDFPLGSG